MELPLERGASRSAREANGAGGWIVLFGLAALVYFLDQLTKALVVQNLRPMGIGYHVPLLGDWLRLSYTINTGAAFGLFPERTVILTALAVAAVPLLIFAQDYLPVSGWTAKICVGLLLGGTLGNLTDRIRLGYVVDFVDAGVGNLRWPSFNVADSAFVVGIIAMLMLALFFPKLRSRRDAS